MTIKKLVEVINDVQGPERLVAEMAELLHSDFIKSIRHPDDAGQNCGRCSYTTTT